MNRGGHFASDEPIRQADLPKVPAGPAQGEFGSAMGGHIRPTSHDDSVPVTISRCYFETSAAALAYMGVDFLSLLNKPCPAPKPADPAE